MSSSPSPHLSSSSLSRFLSPRDQAILKSVTLMRQVSSGQLLRLYFYDGSPKTRRAKLSRTMARLHKWGLVARISRTVGGHAGGSGQFVFTPTTSRARYPDAHTLDITELMVRLTEADRDGRIKLLAFDPEPYSHSQVGHVELKPDGFARIGESGGAVIRYWLEIDRGTEWRSQLANKLRRYVQAYNSSSWPEDETFPLVLWVVPDEQRGRFIQGVAKRMEVPELFDVVTLENAVNLITRENSPIA